jgi:hypothetical protein
VVYVFMLYVFYKGADDDRIWVARPPGQYVADVNDVNNGLAWITTPLNSSISTATSPAVVIFQGALYLFYTGRDNKVYVAHPGGNVSDGNSWSTNAVAGISSEYAPSVAVEHEILNLFYVPAGTSTINVANPRGSNVVAGSGWTTRPFIRDAVTDAAPGAICS